jgi:Family of unknown function (DUF6178)
MNDTAKPLKSQKVEQNEALALERRKILAMTPEKALDAIADHPYPVTLVQSMAEEDFYFLIHHIGPEDALPVLGLASNQQWEYLLDMEGWRADRIDSHSVTRWLHRLLMADGDRFTHWITGEKSDDFAFYLHRNIMVHIREYDEDPGEIGDDYFSEDGTYYVRLRPYPTGDESLQKERDQFLTDVLRRISVFDYAKHRSLLLESTAMIPAETEEELYRLRNIRLAEKGLLPLHEAVGVYQPLKAADLGARRRTPGQFAGRVVESYPLPTGPTHNATGDNLFAQTLGQIHDQAALQQLQAEFAGLCNQIIAADQKKIRGKEALEQVVQKVGGYISIGLEKVLAESDAPRPYASADLIHSHYLVDIYRVGYGCALALKWKAGKWQRAAWFTGHGLPLGFWGESQMGVLGGLLIKKPLFFNDLGAGPLYREFRTLADIKHTETILNTIIAFDDLLGLMEIEPGGLARDRFLTCQNLILTLWANHHLGLSASGQPPVPMPLDQFRRFFLELWVAGAEPPRISDAMRELFLGWLAQRSGLATFEITDRMAPALEQLFEAVEQELGAVKASDLDPRFIQMFLISMPR